MNRKIIGLAALLVVLIAGAVVAYNLLAPGVTPSAAGDTVPVTGADDGSGSGSGNDAAGVTDEDATAGDAESGAANSMDEPVAAPDFTVYDADGNEAHLADFKGEPVVVNFWASWCPPCKQELPDFEKVYQEMGIREDSAESSADGDGQEVRFLMVNLTDGQRETRDTASEYVAGEGYTFPIYYDEDFSAAGTYGVNSIPMTLFIDGDGNIQAYSVGMIDEQTLRGGIEKIR